MNDVSRVSWPAVLVLALIASVAVAQDRPAADGAKTSALIRINLPVDSDRVVSITPDGDRLLLDLPEGSVYPSDFEAASGGLMRGTERRKARPDGRVQLDLELVQGLLDKIVYDPDGIVLQLQSQFERQDGSAESGDAYRLGPGDRLMLTVHSHPDLSTGVTVMEDGTVTAPLVGQVDAEGLTPRQIAGRLTEMLGRSYLVNPQVDVDVETYRSRWVMVAGEVRLSGRQALRGGTRLKEILSEAGGFTDRGGEVIVVSRKLPGSEETQRIEVDRRAFERGESDPVLQHGDIIEVLAADFAYLTGEVRSANRVRIERDMTLLKAISLVGGLTEWADRKRIKILHGAGPDADVEFHNLVKIENGKAEDPLLTGGEIIVVRRRFF